MAKTKEELTQLKNEYEVLTTKLKELTEDELKEVTGGIEMKPGVGLDFGLTNSSNYLDNQNNQK